MGLELTFHNFHIHIRALDTRGILLKNMVYHDNNKHIFFGPAHPSPLSILLKHLHPSHCAHGVTKQLVLRLCCAPINIITAPCMYMHGFTLVYIYSYILGGGFRLPGASGPLGHWPASANGAPKSARKMTCKRLPKCARNGSRNEPKRLQQRFL